MLSLSKSFILHVLNLINKIIPKIDNKCCIITYPTFDDTAKNLIGDAKFSCYKTIILTDVCGKLQVPSWCLDVPVFYKYSLIGLYHFITSRLIVFTHNHIPGIIPVSNQILLNVWHGMPIKDIGLMDNNKGIVPKAHYTIASGDFYKKYLSKAFGMPIDNVLPLPHPRLKSMWCENKDFFADQHSVIGLWLPTYRVSNKKESRVDGDANLKGVGIDDIDYVALNDFLKLNNHIIFIKPHPMSDLACFSEIDNLDNIKLINDEWLNSRSLSLYTFLGMTDYLITDISSVYLDYKLLNKPIIIAFADKNQYLSARCTGGIDYDDVIVEEVLTTQNELEKSLVDINSKVLSLPACKYVEYWDSTTIMGNFFESFTSCLENKNK